MMLNSLRDDNTHAFHALRLLRLFIYVRCKGIVEMLMDEKLAFLFFFLSTMLSIFEPYSEAGDEWVINFETF